MLKTRIVTASILLALFLLALFFLPPLGWAVLVIVMVMQGTAEWARLSHLSGKAANVYWWLTLAVMLLIVWLDMQSPGQPGLWHLLIYGVSALLWIFVVPAWLISGWQMRQPLLMALTGWAVLIPTGLAMMDLRALNPRCCWV